MRMLIVMPSKRRPYTLKTTQWLLKCDLPEDVRFKCFCEPQEAIHYRATLGRRNVAVLDRNDMGLGYALQYAHRYAAERGYDLCFHIDDDVNGFIDRRAQSRYRTEVFGSIVRRIPQKFAQEDKLGLVRFLSARGFYFYKNMEVEYLFRNQGAWGCYVTRVTPDYYRAEIPNYSDTAAQLFFWRDGYYTLTYGLAGINVDVYSNAGGCQSRDRYQDAFNAVSELQREFPKVHLRPARNSVGYDIDISAYRPAEEKLF